MYIGPPGYIWLAKAFREYLDLRVDYEACGFVPLPDGDCLDDDHPHARAFRECRETVYVPPADPRDFDKSWPRYEAVYDQAARDVLSALSDRALPAFVVRDDFTLLAVSNDLWQGGQSGTTKGIMGVSSSWADTMLATGKIQAFALPEQYRELDGLYIVLPSETWETWKAGQGGRASKPRAGTKYEAWTDRQIALLNQGGGK